MLLTELCKNVYDANGNRIRALEAAEPELIYLNGEQSGKLRRPERHGICSAIKKAAASVAVQKSLDIASDTVVDVAQSISQGKKITQAYVAGSLAFNVLIAGNGNGSRESATNAIADSTEDRVRRKAKDSLSDSVSRGIKL